MNQEQEFNHLKTAEEKLNGIFLRIYGLANEYSQSVTDEDVSIRKAKREECVKDFIQYAIGWCFDESGGWWLNWLH